MFNGIIKEIGLVKAVDGTKADRVFEISASPHILNNLENGSSIACDGICLTVISKTSSSFVIEASEETLAVTTASAWQKGRGVNLEPSLRLGDAIDGIITSGHVDSVTELLRCVPRGGSHELVFKTPQSITKQVVTKGSIIVNGVALTVNATRGTDFSVNIIPYTWQHTNLKSLAVSDEVNIEMDYFARYVLSRS